MRLFNVNTIFMNCSFLCLLPCLYARFFLSVLVFCFYFIDMNDALAEDYRSHYGFNDFVQLALAKHQLPVAVIESYLSGVSKNQKVLDLMSRPAEKALEWHEYKAIFINETLIQQGVEFWQKNNQLLNLAASAYQVPVEVILAIIGVETRYGRIMGRFPVLVSLATLAFDYPKRSEFFKNELATLMFLAHSQGLDIKQMQGSYAGAVGMPQFMPSSRLHYAIDFDDDGRVDLRKNDADVIGSVANYFHQHGWRLQSPVVIKATVEHPDQLQSKVNEDFKPQMTYSDWQKLGVSTSQGVSADAELALFSFTQADGTQAYWLGAHNFYVITRYNRSRLYAMAVHQLSMTLAAAIFEVDKK